MANRWRNSGNSERLYFGLQNHCRWWLQSWDLKIFAPWRKAMTNLDSILRNWHYFADKGLSSQNYVFSSSYIWMWELDHKEAEQQRNDAFELWCWRRLLRVPWTARRSNQSILNEISPKYSLEGLMLKLKCLWPPDANSWLIWKDPDAGKDWGQEKGTTEDKIIGWHHRLDGHGFGWTPGVGDGQGGLACCGSWGCKESDTTERLNWTELNWTLHLSLYPSNGHTFLILAYAQTHKYRVYFHSVHLGLKLLRI